METAPEAAQNAVRAGATGGRRFHMGLMGYAPYRSFLAFSPELRQGWWVLRGYLPAMALVSMMTQANLVPANPGDWVVVPGGIWGLGQVRPAGRRGVGGGRQTSGTAPMTKVMSAPAPGPGD